MKPLITLLLVTMFGLAACGPKSMSKANEPAVKKDPMQQMTDNVAALASKPDVADRTIEVQHLLIAFDGSLRGKNAKVPRTKAEAERLAAELFAKVMAGENFDELIKAHTDDSPPGIYGMTMDGAGDMSKKLFPRNGMVPAFGNVGWKLKVGEFGVAAWDAKNSPFGWHIIKRTK